MPEGAGKVMNTLLFVFGFSSLGFAAPNYAPEINALRERQRTFVEVSNRQLEGIHRYASAWERVDARVRRVREVLSVPVAQGSTGLAALVLEKARMSELLEELRLAEPAIRTDLEIATG